MKHLVIFGRFWYDFIVGDDWTVAFGVVVAVAATAAIAHAGATAWPLLPVAVAAMLAISVWRAKTAAKQQAKKEA
jgi:hypothetical protein